MLRRLTLFLSGSSHRVAAEGGTALSGLLGGESSSSAVEAGTSPALRPRPGVEDASPACRLLPVLQGMDWRMLEVLLLSQRRGYSYRRIALQLRIPEPAVEHYMTAAFEHCFRNAALPEAAIRWRVRLESGAVTAEQWQACCAWRQADPRHTAAWQQMDRLEASFRTLQDAAESSLFAKLAQAQRRRIGYGLLGACTAGAVWLGSQLLGY